MDGTALLGGGQDVPARLFTSYLVSEEIKTHNAAGIASNSQLRSSSDGLQDKLWYSYPMQSCPARRAEQSSQESTEEPPAYYHMREDTLEGWRR